MANGITLAGRVLALNTGWRDGTIALHATGEIALAPAVIYGADAKYAWARLQDLHVLATGDKKPLRTSVGSLAPEYVFPMYSNGVTAAMGQLAVVRPSAKTAMLQSLSDYVSSSESLDGLEGLMFSGMRAAQQTGDTRALLEAGRALAVSGYSGVPGGGALTAPLLDPINHELVMASETVISHAVDTITETVDSVLTSAGEFVTGVLDVTSELIGDVVDVAVDVVEGVGDVVSDIIDAIGSALDWLFGGGGETPSPDVAAAAVEVAKDVEAASAAVSDVIIEEERGRRAEDAVRGGDLSRRGPVDRTGRRGETRRGGLDGGEVGDGETVTTDINVPPDDDSGDGHRGTSGEQDGEEDRRHPTIDSDLSLPADVDGGGRAGLNWSSVSIPYGDGMDSLVSYTRDGVYHLSNVPTFATDDAAFSPGFLGTLRKDITIPAGTRTTRNPRAVGAETSVLKGSRAPGSRAPGSRAIAQTAVRTPTGFGSGPLDDPAAIALCVNVTRAVLNAVAGFRDGTF